ncbi:chromobox protein1-like [Tropilaelaps mercedesae]|uniref:Chromobox protein1-like n=1 Tax=Tropilaelaps mercedesae TaxID=418985 RepID=A0A1V9XCY0_9ACAR|nr:chromobox protein1-like [Tropilaelaps mercedesae]
MSSDDKKVTFDLFLCRRWIDYVNRPELAYNSPEHLHNNYRLCAMHFREDDFVSLGNHARLKRHVVPSVPPPADWKHAADVEDADDSKIKDLSLCREKNDEAGQIVLRVAGEMARAPSLSEHERARVAALARAGRPMRAIAREIGRSLCVVRNYLRDQAAYGRRKVGGTRKRKLSKSVEGHMTRLASDSAKSCAAIKRELGLSVHRTTVWRTLNRDRHKLPRGKKTDAPPCPNSRDSPGQEQPARNESTPQPKGFERGLEPEKILGVTNSSGELMFLIQWKGAEEADFVRAVDCNVRYPQMVIGFYERKLVMKY